MLTGAHKLNHSQNYLWLSRGSQQEQIAHLTNSSWYRLWHSLVKWHLLTLTNNRCFNQWHTWRVRVYSRVPLHLSRNQYNIWWWSDEFNKELKQRATAREKEQYLAKCIAKMLSSWFLWPWLLAGIPILFLYSIILNMSKQKSQW